MTNEDNIRKIKFFYIISFFYFQTNKKKTLGNKDCFLNHTSTNLKKEKKNYKNNKI